MCIQSSKRRRGEESLQSPPQTYDDDFDDESTYASSWDSDDSDTSSLDSVEWDVEMEILEAGVNSMLGAARLQSYSALPGEVLLTKSPSTRNLLTISSLTRNSLTRKSFTGSENDIDMVTDTDNVMNMNPVDYLKMVLQQQGVVMDAILPPNDDSYMSIQEQHSSNYSQLAPLARQGDLEAIKAMHNAGLYLQSCNRHGESIVHIVCRRGNSELLQFLMEEGGVTLRVRDDVGRTPLHDAAWTTKPNFNLIRTILKDSPDFLLVKDKRGHLPLAYVPREQWGQWCSFLATNHHLIDAAVQSKFTHICL